MWELVGGAAVAVGASAVGWRIYQGYISQPHIRLAMDREKMEAYYAEAKATLAAAQFPEPKEYAEGFMAEFRSEHRDDHPVFPLTLELTDVAQHVYFLEGFRIPEPPPGTTTLEIARYNDQLASVIRRARNPRTMKVINDTLHETFGTFKKHLPPIARQKLPLDVEGWFEGLTIEVPLVQLMDDVGEAIADTVMHFYSEEARQIGLFEVVRGQIDRNTHMASGVPFSPVKSNRPVFLPDEYPGGAEEITEKYLVNTPFQELFHVGVPFKIPDLVRFEHTHVVGGTGHGKTQTLQNLILKDLERVKEGKASIVVIDSQQQLIPNIAGLRVFAPGQPLHGKLCVIDVAHVEYPPQLNMFAMGAGRGHTMLDRERLQNAAIELLEFTLGALLQTEMTGKQSALFRYSLRALVTVIPEPTLQKFRELMEPGGEEKYRPYLQKLKGTAKAFFENEFSGRQHAGTRDEVVRRLYGLSEQPVWDRMFASPTSKFDMFERINQPGVTLISTDKSLLKNQGTEVMGRFFISLMAMAVQERATVSEKLPCFFYIDEMNDYLAQGADRSIAVILEQARKQRVGVIVAHQYLTQLSKEMRDSLAANTSIKFAGGVSADDAKTLAPMMRTDARFIERQPNLTFAAYVRGKTDTAVALSFPYGTLENQPRMTDEEQETVRGEMRQRYAVHYSELEEPPEGTEHAVDVEFEDVPPDRPRLTYQDPDTRPVEPADEWGER